MYTVLYIQQCDILRGRSAMCRLLHVLALRPPRMPFCCIYMSIHLLCHICPPMCHTWKKCCMNIQYIHHYGLPRKQQHRSQAVTKANRMLVIIYYNFVDRTKETMLPLYKSLVRPHLQYCCRIRNLDYQEDILIEDVLRTDVTQIRTHNGHDVSIICQCRPISYE